MIVRIRENFLVGNEARVDHRTVCASNHQRTGVRIFDQQRVEFEDCGNSFARLIWARQNNLMVFAAPKFTRTTIQTYAVVACARCNDDGELVGKSGLCANLF